MGGSMASALKRCFPSIMITACDRQEGLLHLARERGLIDIVAVDAEDIIDRTDVVIIALPVLAISEVLRKNRETLREKQLVTDTGSLKQEISQMAKTCELNTFIGAHPLAGTELRGAESWNANLFQAANYFITPSATTNAGSRLLLDELIRSLGARAITIDPEVHDEIFSVSSNLPHLLAYLLKSQFERRQEIGAVLEQFACPSYRSATRVARSDSEMVFQMLWGNRTNLAASLRDLRSNLDLAQKALDSGAEMEFRRIFGLKRAQ
jgi:prephenate dehydrogenase